MVQFHEDVIKGWGFRPFGPDDAITASFSRMEILTVQGPKLDQGATLTGSGTLDGIEYKLAAGDSVNALFRTLVGQDLDADEAQWAREKQAAPPYVVLQLGRTKDHRCESAYVKKHDGHLEVYEGFDDAVREAKDAGDRIFQRLAAGLACTFAARDSARNVKHKVKHVAGLTVGVTPEGTYVTIFKVFMHAEGHTLFRMTTDELGANLDASARLAAGLDQRVAKFICMAMNEADDLKKFLFFFLAIEIETNRAYKSLKPQQIEQRLAPSLVNKSVSTLVVDKHIQKSLKARFIWCAAHYWNQITEQDVALFEALLKARNDIAHGNAEAAPKPMVLAAEELAKKLHQREGASS